MKNLHSTFNKAWETVTQIIHFKCGEKRTIEGVITKTIKQWEMTKFWTTKWVMRWIMTKNVNCIEIIGKIPNEIQKIIDNLA